MTGPSIFISKTFEILEVQVVWSRTIPIQWLLAGTRKEPTSPSKTSKSSSRKFCPSTSDTATSVLSSDSSTCMTSTKFEMNKTRASSSTVSSAETPSTFPFTQTPPQKHQKKRMFQQEIQWYCWGSQLLSRDSLRSVWWVWREAWQLETYLGCHWQPLSSFYFEVWGKPT